MRGAMNSIIGFFVTVIAVFAPYSAWADPPEAILSFFLGKDVMVRAASDTAWHAAKLRQPLEKGNWLRTGKECRAEILLKDGSVIRVGEETEYQLTELTGEQGDFKLVKGKIWANIKKLGTKRDRFNIHAPTAVAAIRAFPPMEAAEQDSEAVYEVVVNEDQSVQITVYQGQVEVAPPTRPSKETVERSRERTDRSTERAWGSPQQVDRATWNRLVDEILLRERQRMLVKADGSTEQDSISEKAEDEWLQWNRERDRVLELAPGGVQRSKGAEEQGSKGVKSKE